jgi:methylated-DNA-[protein]-cysteine S-methyltransferase
MRVLLSRPGAAADGLVRPLFPGIAEASCPEIDAVADLIGAFLEGGDIRFSLDVVRMDLASAFQRRVLEAEHAIPRGSVSTYGRIASHLGIPSGARAVGTALATNPFPIIVPCHRSVRSDGMLGGFQGGLAMKAALLRMEGVSVAEKGRVEDAIFHY